MQLQKQKRKRLPKKVVLLGGGSGVYRVAKYLKHLVDYITAIHTVFDSGGSTGKIRDELNVPGYGDMRRGFQGLAGRIDPILLKIFEERFDSAKGSVFDDHSLGNIIIARLAQREGGLIKASDDLCKLLKIRGRVLPISLDYADLQGRYTNGARDSKEHLIDTRPSSDRKVLGWVELTHPANICPESREAMQQSDLVVLCPGSIQTSVVPNLLVKGVPEALEGKKVAVVTNIMIKKNENITDATHFLRIVTTHLRRKVDVVICDSGRNIPRRLLKKYQEEDQSVPTGFDIERLRDYAHCIIVSDFAEVNRQGHIRHGATLAKVLVNLL